MQIYYLSRTSKIVRYITNWNAIEKNPWGVSGLIDKLAELMIKGLFKAIHQFCCSYTINKLNYIMYSINLYYALSTFQF